MTDEDDDTHEMCLASTYEQTYGVVYAKVYTMLCDYVTCYAVNPDIRRAVYDGVRAAALAASVTIASPLGTQEKAS